MELVPVEMLSSAWVRGPGRIENGDIVLDGSRSEEYAYTSPEQSEQMAWDLAVLGVRSADEREVLRFVRRYGMLFHSAEDLGVGACREALEDWWAEAARLRLVGVLYQAIQDARRDESARPIQNLLRGAGGGFPFLDPSSEHFVDDYISWASIMLVRMINEGLNGGSNEEPNEARPPASRVPKNKPRCWWGLTTTAPGEFRLTQYPPDLLTRAYSAFAVLIATNVETRFCPVCNKQFRPKPRQGECCSPAHQSTYRGWRRKGDPRAVSR